MSTDSFLAKYNEEYVASLREVFSRYQNRQNWKFPFKAFVPFKEEAALLVEAVDFYLADSASMSRIAGGYMVSTKGYQAD